MDGRFVFKPCLLRKLPKLALIRLMLPRFGLGVSPLLPLLFPPPLSPLFHFPHSASTARWANKLTDRRVPYAGSWRSRIEQKPRRLSSRCRTSCFLTWIIGSRYRIVPRHFTSMASFLVRPHFRYICLKLILVIEMLSIIDLDLLISIKSRSIVLVRHLSYRTDGNEANRSYVQIPFPRQLLG